MSLSERKTGQSGTDIQEEDDFCKIDSIGPSTEDKLKEGGVQTFKDLSKLRPMELHSKYGIVLATATKIISGAVYHITDECPACRSSSEGNFSTSWSVVLREIDSESDLVCESCGWDGQTEEL